MAEFIVEIREIPATKCDRVKKVLTPATVEADDLETAEAAALTLDTVAGRTVFSVLGVRDGAGQHVEVTLLEA